MIESLPSFCTVCGGRKPSSVQRRFAIPDSCLMMSRRAWMLVSAVLLQICSSRSPSHRLASSASLRKDGISTSCRGFAAARPKRPSNSEAPTPRVTVRLSGNTVGPSTPESSGGSCGLRSATGPPFIRKAMRSSSLRNRRSSTGRPRPTTSIATTIAAACVGVVMPDWWMPWKGCDCRVLSVARLPPPESGPSRVHEPRPAIAAAPPAASRLPLSSERREGLAIAGSVPLPAATASTPAASWSAALLPASAPSDLSCVLLMLPCVPASKSERIEGVAEIVRERGGLVRQSRLPAVLQAGLTWGRLREAVSGQARLQHVQPREHVLALLRRVLHQRLVEQRHDPAQAGDVGRGVGQVGIGVRIVQAFQLALGDPARGLRSAPENRIRADRRGLDRLAEGAAVGLERIGQLRQRRGRSVAVAEQRVLEPVPADEVRIRLAAGVERRSALKAVVVRGRQQRHRRQPLPGLARLRVL